MKRSEGFITSGKRFVITSLILSACLGFCNAHASQTYQLTDLGAFTAQGNSFATDINNLGQISGYSWETGAVSYAAIWNNGQIAHLGPTSVTWSYAYAINDSGVVVGVDRGAHQSPVQWVNGQRSALVNPPCCGTVGAAEAINNHNVIAGWYEGNAYTWSNGTMQKLSNLTPGYGSSASGINDLGQVVGVSVSTADFLPADHAVVWNNGKVTDLGTASGFSSSFAEAINDKGEIVGQSNNGYQSSTHATLWREGQIIDLGSLNDDADASFAKDINNLGQIVGYSLVDPADPLNLARAVIWENGVNPVALESLIDPLDPLFGQVQLYAAWGINDLGQIVGYGLINGRERAFLLNPLAATVPEPNAQALMIVGFGLLFACRRKIKS